MRLLPTLIAATALFAFPSFAQATRTWVSGVGDDINPCSRDAPCKTFAGAIAKTDPGGEIDVLDSGGFGAVTITKAITIDARNAIGGVLVIGTNSITISAGADDVVVLRGLSIQGGGSGLNGVRFLTGKALHLEASTIAAFAVSGISFEPTTATSQLFVKNTVISQVASAAPPSAAAIKITAGVAVLDHVTMATSQYGLLASGTAKVTLHHSNVSGNSIAGVQASGTAEISVERSVIAANATGVLADTGTTVRLSDTMLSHNALGISGPVTSFGNNRVAAGNTVNGAPTSTVSQQ